MPEKGASLGKNASTVVLELQQHINTAFEKAERGESKITVDKYLNVKNLPKFHTQFG